MVKGKCDYEFICNAFLRLQSSSQDLVSFLWQSKLIVKLIWSWKAIAIYRFCILLSYGGSVELFFYLKRISLKRHDSIFCYFLCWQVTTTHVFAYFFLATTTNCSNVWPKCWRKGFSLHPHWCCMARIRLNG